MRNQIFHSPGNEEAELAKIPGDGDPPPPHWHLYLKFFQTVWKVFLFIFSPRHSHSFSQLLLSFFSGLAHFRLLWWQKLMYM